MKANGILFIFKRVFFSSPSESDIIIPIKGKYPMGIIIVMCFKQSEQREMDEPI
jgi:hypothetical protein